MQLARGIGLGIFLLLSLPVWLGCTSAWFSKKDPNSAESKRAKIRQRLSETGRPIPLSEVASPRQMTFGALENMGLVTHLPGTGGTVKPSQQREKLLDQMRKNDVPDPNALLDSKQTTMVAALTAVPPAARKGDRVNVSIKLSTFAEATDLRQGWLRETSLVEMGNLGGRIRESFERARAEGPLVTLAQYTGRQDPEAKLEAVIVGGARLMRGRELGLGLTTDFADALTMAALIPDINARFTYFDGSKQEGVATPLSEDYIELQIPPRYTADPYHYVNVILQILFNATPEQREEQLVRLSLEVKDPNTTRDACLALEAIGEPAKEILAEHLAHPDVEVRFGCSQALAYLGDRRCVPVLTEIAAADPDFRAQCMNALASMDNYQAEEALKSLLSLGEPETRYGAVRALRKRNPRDPLIVGDEVSRVGSLLEIPSSGQDFVAVSMVDVPEIVFFGHIPELKIPAFYNVNSSLLIQTSDNNNDLIITHFRSGQNDLTVVCDSDLRSALRGIAHVGGSYGDWVSFIRECQELKMIDTPVFMNPIPDLGRAYERKIGSGREGTATSETATTATKSSSESSDSESSSTAWFNPRAWWN